MAINLDDYMRYGPMTLNPYDDGLRMKMPIECDIDSMAKDLAREIDEAATPRTLEILETRYGYVKAERLQDLQAENEKLREENQSIGLIAYELGRNSMADENKKLRELVRTLYMCSRVRCDQCEHETHGNTCAFDAEYEMRELGVEV